MVDVGGSDRRLAESLSAAMKSRRASSGLRQTEAAERAGMDPKHYQAMENGFTSYRDRAPANPTMTMLLRLAVAYDIDVTDFVTEVFGGLELSYDGSTAD